MALDPILAFDGEPVFLLTDSLLFTLARRDVDVLA